MSPGIGLLMLVAGVLVVSLAHAVATASTTTYMSRVDFDTAAGATRVIDFSTDDFGLPITDPSVNVRFHFLGLRDVCFQGVNSYYNSFIYDFPASTIRAELPSGTYAFGTALGPF